MGDVTRQVALDLAVKRLRHAGVDSPELSAQVLLAFVLGCTRVDLFLERSSLVQEGERSRFQELVDRRSAGEPVAYLTGVREFFGLEFQVRPGVLIPRPETELLVERVRESFAPDRRLRFVDLGTGSGVIAITLGVLFPRAVGMAVDICDQALRVAVQNIRAHRVAERIYPVRGDLGAVPASGGFDLVVSNPPYLSSAELLEISHEVRNFEPERALVGGPRGVELLEVLAHTGRRLLRPGGRMLVEIGCLQGKEALAIFSGWDRAQVHRDLAGRDRLLEACRN
jgi:release factor glutamine methyltransferase